MIRSIAGPLILLFLVLSCDSQGTGPADRSAAPPILKGQNCLILVLDALHADNLGCYGEARKTSPAIDGLAAEGVRFSRAWSQTSWTLPSTASLMTGQFQETHGVRTKTQRLSDKAATLAEAFFKAGYECLGFSQIPYASSLFGMAQGFTHFEDLFREEGGDEDGAMADAVIEALHKENTGKPRMIYAHFRRPHAPYDPPEALRQGFIDPAYDGPVEGLARELSQHNTGKKPLDAEDLRRLHDLYQAGIRAVDAEVGRILQAIDREKTLVVLLSDHGEAFGQHGLVGHNFTSYEEMIHIPCIFSHPALATPRVVDRPVMTIDIAPTLVDLFGIEPLPSELQGRSLYPDLLGERGEDRSFVYTSSKVLEGSRDNQMFGVFDGRFKYLRGPGRHREALFDLVEDPLETRDLKEARAETFDRLKQAWEEWFDSQHTAETETVQEAPADVLEKLKGLGYFGGYGE